ncbi:hypothetical protein G6F35_016834 [Rhizopus arrhizus]|nr:hypothetical protein G6F35_016834 [Rhizopus arrhizus]
MHALAQQVRGRAFAGPLGRIIAVGEGRVDGRDQAQQQIQEARALGLVGPRRQARLRRHIVQVQDHCRAFRHDLAVWRDQRRHLPQRVQMQQPVALGAGLQIRHIGQRVRHVGQH